jgi:hypothetical protein
VQESTAGRVTWGIRYHQALRFYPDPSVGYEYPETYNQIFGKDYVPPPHVKQAYEYARNHKSYMDARMITVHDLYAFDPTMKVSIDPFIDIIGRHFKQPKEGLGYDNSPVANSPVAHKCRTLIFPDNPLSRPPSPTCRSRGDTALSRKWETHGRS